MILSADIGCGTTVEVPSNSDRPKAFMTAHQFRMCLAGQGGMLMGSLFVSCVYDSLYYLPPIEDALALMERVKIDQLQYVAEISDCDDFDRKLVSAFLDDAYRTIDGEQVRRPPYCFGLALSYGHAFNCMVNDDRIFRLVEPQTSEIFLPSESKEGLVEVRV
jgi:hypothetical protein